MNHFQICKTCLHRKADVSGQLYCGYKIDPESDIKCTNYSLDEIEKIHLQIQKAKTAVTASGGLRFANYILDMISYFIFSMLIGVFLGIIFVLAGTDPTWIENSSKITQYFIGFIVLSGYYIFFEGVFGQTPGKMITGTKVVTENGEKPTIEMIMTRTLCRFIPFEAFSFLNSNAIGWHDSLSKTRVVIKNG
jgi:uncharacterized RDD family membrane protein YckC